LTNQASNWRDWIVSKTLIRLSKQIVLPGFQGMSTYDVTRFFVKAMSSGTLTTRGGSIAFSFLMAIFPAIIFFFSLIPHIPIDGFQEILLAQLETILPREAYILSKETIEDIVNQPRDGLLSFGFFAALLFATNGTNAMIEGFNQSSIKLERMSYLKQRLFAFILFVIIVSTTAFAVSLIVFNQYAIEYLSSINFLDTNIKMILFQVIRWVIIIALFYFNISFIYAFAPAVKKQWKFFSAGSTFTTQLIIITSVAFSYYINNFGQYNKIYGSIGTLLVIMLWLYLVSTFILIGYELNASISNAKLIQQND
jgi:membrane protein